MGINNRTIKYILEQNAAQTAEITILKRSGWSDVDENGNPISAREYSNQKPNFDYKKVGPIVLRKDKNGGNSTDTTTTDDNDTIYSCINNYNERAAISKLSTHPALTSADGKPIDGTYFRYEDIVGKLINGRPVQLVFLPDYKVYLRYSDGNLEKVSNTDGKWECGNDGKSYKIYWDSGEVMSRPSEGETGISNNSNTPSNSSSSGINNTSNTQTNTLSQSCPSGLKACSSKERVKKGLAKYKICMKCPEIKEIQNDPEFNKFYSDRLREANKKITTDEIFGPIMKLAVGDFQEFYSPKLEKTDEIDALTLSYIENDSAPTNSSTPSQEGQKTPSIQPSQEGQKTPSIQPSQERKIEIRVATKDTKF